MLCLEELSITRSSTALIGRTTDSAQEGTLAGVVTAGAVAIEMYLLGGMQVRRIATTGNALALSAVAWLVANFCVRVAEEFWYRSYALRTLWKSIGFWPGAILIGSRCIR